MSIYCRLWITLIVNNKLQINTTLGHYSIWVIQLEDLKLKLVSQHFTIQHGVGVGSLPVKGNMSQCVIRASFLAMNTTEPSSYSTTALSTIKLYLLVDLVDIYLPLICDSISSLSLAFSRVVVKCNPLPKALTYGNIANYHNAPVPSTGFIVMWSLPLYQLHNIGSYQ